MYLGGGFTRFSDDPAEDAGAFVRQSRLRQEVFKDPLNCQFSRIIYYISSTRQNSWSCSCGANVLKGQAHTATCLITPEYAATAKDLETTPELISGTIAFAFWELHWPTWDENKYAIRNLEKGQKFPWEAKE